MKFKSTLYIVVYLVFHSVLNAQTKYSKEVEAKILEVEQHLCSSVFQYEGKPFMNLHDRMAFYGIKGLSILSCRGFVIRDLVKRNALCTDCKSALTGLGDQIKSSKNFSNIRDYIEIIEHLEFKNGQWKPIN